MVIKSKKNNGFTFVELLIYMSIFSLLSFSVLNNYSNTKLKQELLSEQRKIVSFIRKSSNYVKNSSEGNYFFYVNFEEKILSLNENNVSSNKEIYKINLSNKFNYFSNNKEKNASFQRELTDVGNFNRGFTLFISHKERIYYKISVNTVNALRYPIITVYKPCNKIYVGDNVSDSSIWKEEN